MRFRLHPLRFSFIAQEPVHFAEGQASNILRGAFGTILRRIESHGDCLYRQVFAPAAKGSGPSGFADRPRPFVFRAMHLDGLTFSAGSGFHFDLHLFDTMNPAIASITEAFTELAREGLGPGRGKVQLIQVSQLNVLGEPTVLEPNPKPLELHLDPSGARITHLRVKFVTPTELKHGQQIASQPDFGILASRARDRIATLSGFYGDGPLPLDFRAFGQRASEVRMTRCEIKNIENKRRSSRTGQTHPLSGFIGEAEYEGDLAEFLPCLQAAKWTGVGRQTVWGKGQLEVD